MKKGKKNWNPTGKEVFIVYQCPQCGRTDCSLMPAKWCDFRPPFFITCDCDGYVIYQQAWICEPYKGGDVWIGFITGDVKIMRALKYELKEVTDIIDADGVMVSSDAVMRDPRFLEEFERVKKDSESKKAMYV